MRNDTILPPDDDPVVEVEVEATDEVELDPGCRPLLIEAAVTVIAVAALAGAICGLLAGALL